jgi:N utilization substance protein A
VGSKTALVVVPEDQLSLAIGKDGQNARLAARLTNWRIDIKSLIEAASDWLFALNNEDIYKDQAKQLKEQISEIEDIMSRKNEGRVISLKEYDVLAKFVDSLESNLFEIRQEAKQEYESALEEVKRNIPITAYDTPIPEYMFPTKVFTSLSAADINNLGDLAIKTNMDPDSITDLDGIGTKTLENIQEIVANLSQYVPEVIEEEEVEEIIEEIEEVPEEIAEEITEEITEEISADIVETEKPDIPVVEEESDQPEESIEDSEEVEKKEEDDEKEPEEELSFEEMFNMESRDFKKKEFSDEDFDESSDSKEEKKKKKKKYQEIEYDPDLDMTIVRKKRKRGGDDWEWEE